jgi:hypothetical protein
MPLAPDHGSEPIELSRRFNQGYQEEDEELQQRRRIAKSELIPAATSVTIILRRREDLKLKAK